MSFTFQVEWAVRDFSNCCKDLNDLKAMTCKCHLNDTVNYYAIVYQLDDSGFLDVFSNDYKDLLIMICKSHLNDRGNYHGIIFQLDDSYFNDSALSILCQN